MSSNPQVDLVRRTSEVLGTHKTGPKVSRRIIPVMRDGKEKPAALRKYNALRQKLNRGRRSDADAGLTSQTQSEMVAKIDSRGKTLLIDDQKRSGGNRKSRWAAALQCNHFPLRRPPQQDEKNKKEEKRTENAHGNMEREQKRRRTTRNSLFQEPSTSNLP